MIPTLFASALVLAASVQAAPLERSLAAINNSVPNFTYKGCVSDVLSHALPISLGKGGSPAACAALCTSKGYTKYCGVTNAGDCYASTSNKIYPHFPVWDAVCQLGPCSGDKKQACGGLLGMMIYKGYSSPSVPVVVPTVPSTTSASSTASSTASGTAPAASTSAAVPSTKLATYNSFSYAGCYSDNNPGRTILNLVTAQQWSIESCLAAVRSASYTYGGVEYGGECWGSDQIESTGTLLDPSACNMTCNDNPLETCGGNNVIDVYKLDISGTKSTLAPLVGCYTDSLDTRTLANLVTVANWTADTCVLAAKAAGYKYAGVEYGGECWGGNSFGGSLQAPSHCGWACNDNAAQTCGANLSLDVYQLK